MVQYISPNEDNHNPYALGITNLDIRLRARRARARACMATTLFRSSKYFCRSCHPRNAACIRVAAFRSRMPCKAWWGTRMSDWTPQIAASDVANLFYICRKTPTHCHIINRVYTNFSQPSTSRTTTCTSRPTTSTSRATTLAQAQYLSLLPRKHASRVAIDSRNSSHVLHVLGADNVSAGIALHHDNSGLHAVAAELLQVRDHPRAEEYLCATKLELVILGDGCKGVTKQTE